MGFDLEKDQQQNNNQLSLFDYKMPKADFVSSSKGDAYDYNAWLLAQKLPEKSKTGRFLTLSAALHAAAVLFVAVVAVPLVEEVKTDTITIEIEDVPPVKFTAAPKGIITPPTQGGEIAQETLPKVEELEKAGSPDDVIAPAKAPTVAPVAAKLPEKAPAPKAAQAKAPAPVKATPSVAAAPKGGTVAEKTDFKAVPMTVDDIAAPELDNGALADTKVESNFNEDFNEDFAKTDASHKAAIENEEKSISAMAAALSDEQNEALDSAEAETADEANKLAALQDRVREKNAQAVASALAAEKAAALAKAREKAEREAAAKQAAGIGGNGGGRGTEEGIGAGNNGDANVASKQVSGVPQGVRSLDQLRQMPGNPRPQYERQERLRGDQGAVVFVAYISKEGHPSQFRMLKSTGFRNLDAKTLIALKKWRFYPGQEGWVELPFRWDLKGGAQEDGGLLRSKVSQN